MATPVTGSQNLSRTKKYLLSISLLALFAAGFFVPQAFAAPPANDDFDAAISVGTVLPFRDILNTSEAITAADDPDCAGNGPTVWYVFTPSQDIEVTANTFGSDYDTTLSVYTGSRGALTQIACNDDSQGVQSNVIFNAVAGETYFLMVGAFASGAGGNLVFSMDLAPPPVTFELAIDSAGSVNPKTGVATISGTLGCSREVSAELFFDLKQRKGRSIGTGSSFTPFVCDGETRWSATVSSPTLLFTGGRADVSAFAFTFDPIRGEFVSDDAARMVKLRGGK